MSWFSHNRELQTCVRAYMRACMYIITDTELPSLPIYREISRKYSKINPISRSPGFDLQSPAKESFCIFLRVFFDFFCRRTVLPAVSHLRYTESAESSRAETIEVYPTAGSVTCWPSRSMQAAAATVLNLTEAWQMVSGRQSARRKLTLQ